MEAWSLFTTLHSLKENSYAGCGIFTSMFFAWVEDSLGVGGMFFASSIM